MEIYNLQNDLKVFGSPVKTFPDGISEAFDALVKSVGGFNRPFYGISYMSNGQMIYLATALELYAGEAEEFSCEQYIIDKGEYLATTVYDWRKKTGSIKNIFQEMMGDSRLDKTKPAIEWYKNDNEMVCMVRIKEK